MHSKPNLFVVLMIACQLFCPQAASACQPDEVIALAKQGFVKADIDKLCAAKIDVSVGAIEKRITELAAASNSEADNLPNSQSWSSVLYRVDNAPKAYRANIEDGFQVFANLDLLKGSYIRIERNTSAIAENNSACARLTNAVSRLPDLLSKQLQIAVDHRPDGPYYFEGASQKVAQIEVTCGGNLAEIEFSWRN